jgi:hypothetical protein
MTSKLPRSLLIGGASLSLGVLLIDALHHAMGDGFFYALLASVVGFLGWWLQKPVAETETDASIKQVDPIVVQKTLNEAEQVLTQLRAEAEEPESKVAETVLPEVSHLNAQIAQIVAGMQRSQIRLAVIGGKGSGKTALIQQLQVNWATPKLILITETPSFVGTHAAGLAAETTALARANTADLVLFLVTSDITESEFLLLTELANRKRTLLLLNKQDQFLPDERQLLLTAMRSRLQDWLQPEDIIAVAAAPNPIKVRQHQANGEAKEWLEEQAPQMAELTERLNQILEQESERLVLTSSFDDAKTLKAKAQQTLKDVRRTRAIPTLEKYQWIAAASAFASPLPTLDMVATAAINAQMVMELGKVYRQQFSMQQAQKVAIEIGSLMLKFGVVELSTQAIATFFKTNAITYVAGGAVQAVSAAYLTRLAGLSLIEYFSTQDPTLAMQAANPLAVERISQIMRSVFQASQQQNRVKEFVSQAIERLLAKPSAPAPQPSVPPPQPIPVENQLPAMTAEPLQIPLPEAKLPEKHEIRVPLSASNAESSNHLN